MYTRRSCQEARALQMSPAAFPRLLCLEPCFSLKPFTNYRRKREQYTLVFAAIEAEPDASKAAGQSLQETVSALNQQASDPFAYILQIDRLQHQLQLKPQNAQNIQDELDDVRTKSMDEEATALDKLQKALGDIRHLQDANKTLSQIIRDMEIGREAMDKERHDL
jgi:cell division septation protein DedD